MNSHGDSSSGNRDVWSADHDAVWFETSAESNGGPTSATLHHPSYPLWEVIARTDVLRTLRALANHYLALVRDRAYISDEVLNAVLNDSDGGPDFGWLPVSWGAGDLEQSRHPSGSFWVARETGTDLHDRTLVLLAGYRLKGRHSAGGEVGLRLVVHLDPRPRADQWTARITGLSTSRLPAAFKAAQPIETARSQLQSRIGTLAATLNYPDFAIDGMAYVDPDRDQTVRVFLSCGRPSSDDTGLRNFRLVADLPTDGSEAKVLVQHERVSHANSRVFAHDPASCPPPPSPALRPAPFEKRRATRQAALLNRLRITSTRIPSHLLRPGGTMEVRQTRLGQVNADPGQVQDIDLAYLPLRSDNLAAAHAYLRGDELLRRLEAYGLTPPNYFKGAGLPLLLRHRAPVKGAHDGISVNAQVRPGGIGPGVFPPLALSPPPVLEVSFGWAELAHRSRLPNAAARLREQPMGLAADPRWAWHEFSHVLIFASIGELEFRFAHSAGDALAAIVSDPDSQRATTLSERGLTFPWVFTPRRHDRDATTGWCWCGRRNLSRLAQAPAGAPRGLPLGYFEEQLLSSSLFRLYRCIGGDDVDPATRRSASDYCVYLVMRGIQLLGLESTVPARRIGQLVHALIDADIGTGIWNITANWPEADPEPSRNVRRVGGCVHKVIRWAFEQQGWQATGNPTEAVEGLGRRPPVDIYIEDGRPGADGGYDPVSLTVAPGQTPKWHAGDAGIVIELGKVAVKVQNRGLLPALNVAVQCWVLAIGQNPEVPSSWILLSPNSAAQTVNPGASETFAFDALDGGAPLAGPRVVRASASCPADPSNLDPLAMLPMAGLVTPVADLVANDNNLGLRELNFV